MSSEAYTPNLPPVVADIFTVPIGKNKPLGHPDIYYEFQLPGHAQLARAIRKRQLRTGKEQGNFLFTLLGQLPTNNPAWVNSGVHIPPAINCYENAAIDIFNTAVQLPSQAMRYLADNLSQAWDSSNAQPPYNDEILLPCYQRASKAKDIRQSYGLSLLCAQYLTPDGITTALNEVELELTFTGTRAWTTMLEVAFERSHELLYNDTPLGDFLAQSPITGHRMQSIAQMPVVHSSVALSAEWINNYHTTS